ncbi:hypothetical protein Tco_0678938 [Tanacetum coccineum]|uniref:Reverse transcriptase domain-containing protein n=1 Tax=Tanacetum coccineum TaxID=301880 RepID=A0ABQ4XGF9_9ASTR
MLTQTDVGSFAPRIRCLVSETKKEQNLAADHLSRLENPHQDKLENKEITETFPLETLGSVALRVDSTPWFADFANYHAGNFIVKECKLKSRWSGPFTIVQVFPYGTVELSQNSEPNFKERISKKRTKNKAKTTKPDTEWKSVEKTKSRQSPRDETSSRIVSDEEIGKKELEAHTRFPANIQEVLPANQVRLIRQMEQISKQTESVNKEVHNNLLKSFAKLENHSISLELALQQCKEQMKNNSVCKENGSNVFRKEREQYHEIQDLKAQMQDKNIAISELKKLIEKCKGKSVETQFDKPSVVRQPNAQRIPKPSVLGKPTPFSNSPEMRSFQTKQSVNKTNVSDGLFKQVTQQNLPQNRKQAEIHSNVLKPGMYRIATTTTQNREPQLPHASRNTNPHVSKSLGVNHTTSVSRPQLKSYQVKDKVVPNNSQVKFNHKEVEEHHRISSISRKTKSVTACNDSSKSRTLNVNVVCAECGKCVFNSNHDACVSRYLNDVNARTKKPKVVPISASKPKRKANKSVATPHKKIVASDTTIQKSKSYHKELYENTNQEWKWWIAKKCPSGYKWTQKPHRTKKIWMPKIRKEDVSTSISPTIDIVSRITNVLKISNSLGSNLSNVPSSSNSLADCITHPIHYLNQGNVTIKQVYYVEGLNHNLFSVGQFCDADLEVAFRKLYLFCERSSGNMIFSKCTLLEEYYNPSHGHAEDNTMYHSTEGNRFKKINLSILFVLGYKKLRSSISSKFMESNMPVHKRRQLVTVLKCVWFDSRLKVWETSRIKPFGKMIIKLKWLWRIRMEKDQMSLFAQPEGFVYPDHPEKVLPSGKLCMDKASSRDCHVVNFPTSDVPKALLRTTDPPISKRYSVFDLNAFSELICQCLDTSEKALQEDPVSL